MEEELKAFIDRQLCRRLGLHHCDHLPTIKIRDYRIDSIRWGTTSIHTYQCRCCGRTFEKTIFTGKISLFIRG